ncbi:MAG: SusC/RagA family TonB-linked outer membrane protein [Gemmatimonadales bacterium]
MRTAGLGLVALLAAGVAQAQQATVTGKVTDQANGQPLAGARVQATGTNSFAITNQQGQYTIRGLTGGNVALRIVMLGYASQTRSVAVSGETTVDWALSAVPYTLEEIVTTATGEQLKRELGNSVSRVEATQLVDAAPVTSLTEVLTGRVAGVVAIANDGIVGSGSRIRIRGVSSATLATDPLVYVDGVRVSERGPVLSTGNGGNSPSFFNDLNPEEIESIEVVKGPSAATLYGTQAANGVIRITTKRGKAGPARWTAYAENGIVQDKSDYPAAWFLADAQKGPNGETQQCLLFVSVAGGCTRGQAYSRNITKDPFTSPLKDGYRMQYGLQVNGGTDAVRYFFSGEFEDQDGTIKMPDSDVAFLKNVRGITTLPDKQLDPSHLRKVNLRSNIGATLSSKAEVNISTGYTNTDNLIPQTGDNLQGVLVGAVFGTANPDAGDDPYAFARPAYGLSNYSARKSNHFINSGNINFRPTNWLTTRATVGLDYIGFEDQGLVRNGEACPFCGEDQGARTINRFQSYKYSVDFGATANFNLTSRIAGKASAGLQYNKDALTVSNNYGKNLAPGAETITGASEKVSSEATTKVVTLGTYVEQQFGLDDRFFVTGALRVDQNSSFGQDSRTAYYPKISGSFVVMEGKAGMLNSLRLRSAYGATGQQPPSTAALTYYGGVTVALLGGNKPGVSLQGLGDAALKPERSTEVEAGFDAGFLSNRVNLEATVYKKKTRDALIARPLAGSLGAVASQYQNLGQVQNQGLELSVSARPIESRRITWDLNLEASFNKNELLELADGVPDPQGFFYRHAVGQPLYALYGTTLKSYEDANGDGFITPDEVVVSDTAEFLGNSIPNKSASLNSSIGLFGNKLRLGSQLEAKWGWKSLEVNTGFQCLAIQNCAGFNNPEASLFEQARAVSFTFGSYATDAKFIRLRELSLGWTLPKQALNFFRAANGTLTLTARNLKLWTGFTSWDPEINTAAGTNGDGPNYNFVQPGQPRTFLLRLNLQF